MKFLATEGAPKAIGPYSQAIIEGGLLFASGQIPLDPASGELVGGGIEASTTRVLDNLERQGVEPIDQWFESEQVGGGG